MNTVKDSYCKRSRLYDSPRCVTGCSKYKEWPNQSFSWHCTKFIGSIDRNSPCVMFAVSAHRTQASCCPIRPVSLALVRRTTSLAKRPPGEGGRFYVKAFQPSDASASEEGENCRLVRNASFQQGDACGREDLRKNSRRGVGLSAGLCFIIHRVQFRGRRGDGAWLTMGLQAPARTVPDSRKETDWPGCRDAQVK